MKWLFVDKICFLEELWRRAYNIKKYFPLFQGFEISRLVMHYSVNLPGKKFFNFLRSNRELSALSLTSSTVAKK